MNIKKISVSLHCVGTGDAFGSGGRLNSCFHLAALDKQMLIDCGCSTLIGLQRCNLIPSEIDTVVVGHLHGDHFGGIPYLFLEGKYVSHRKKPLVLVGPPKLKQQVEAAIEALYPGVFKKDIGFPVEYQILNPEKPLKLNSMKIECWPVKHGRCKDAYGLRIEVSGKVISYTGDTEWTDNLIPLAQKSDLLIAECFAYDKPVPAHLDYLTLLKQREKLNCKRLVLTHMGPEMLARLDQLEIDVVNDGDLIEL